jgi:hypothetical protein
VVDRRRGAAIAALAELISTGEPVLAVCADASRRRALARAAADPRRFGGPPPRFACCRCGEDGLEAVLADGEARPGLVLTDWWALARRPDAAGGFAHVVAIDPPPFEEHDELVRTGREGARGHLHLAWGAAELEFSLRCLARDWDLRGAVAEIWRTLNAAGVGTALGAAELRQALGGAGRHPRTPEVAGRCVAVLCELGLCEWSGDLTAPELRVVSSKRTELERSQVYRACAERHQEAIRYLRGRPQESAAPPAMAA